MTAVDVPSPLATRPRRTGRAARVIVSALSALLLVACGKESTSAPRPQGGGAVTLTVRSGDGQQAAPGAPLPAAPVVLATNAAGQPQAGIAVSFAIDSGAGTLAATQVTTGPDGTASPNWTMGAAEGANVLRVSAAGASTIRIRAMAAFPGTALLTNVTVPRAGGLLTVALPGNPFNGLTLAVPDSAYSGPAVFSISTRNNTPPTLPAGYAQVGPALVITSSQAVATQPMVLTIPVSVASADTALAAFFVDPVSGRLEAVPVAARTATTLTVFSRHFTADRMLKSAAEPRLVPKVSTGPQALVAASFSPVIIIIVSVPATTLNAATATEFQPGRDDWEFVNYGTNVEPRGVCAGMSISAMYYHYTRRAGGTLNGKYNPVASGAYRDYTNNKGLRLATVVQGDFNGAAIRGWERVVDAYSVITTVPKARLYYQSLVMAMQVTRMPQFLAIYGDSIAHAVIAFGSANGAVSFSDPNEPGNSRTMTFARDAFAPFPFSSFGGSPADVIKRVVPLGASAMIDDAALAAAWVKLEDESIGSDRFPKAWPQRFDTFADKFVNIDTTLTVLVTSEQDLRLQTKCPLMCPRYFAPDTTIVTQVLSETGVLLAEDAEEPASSITLRRGQQRFGVIEFAVTLDNKRKWNRFRWLTVNYQPVRLEPVTPVIRPDSTLTFTVTATDLAPQVARYTWSFNDGTPIVTTTVPTTTHKYPTVGNYKALVVLTDARNTVLGKDSTNVTVGTLPLVGWALRTATVTAATLPPAGIGTERSDTIAFNFATTTINRLTATPSNTAIFVGGVAVEGPGCDAGALLQQAPPGVTPPDSLVPGHFVGLLGTCGDPDFTGSLVLGPLGTGTLVGSAAAVPNPDVIVVPGGSINASMNARTLTGTFVWNVRYSTGLGTYTVTFTAVQVRPR